MILKLTKRKVILLILLVLLAIPILVYREGIVYGYEQAKGQLTMIAQARPIAECIKDTTLPADIRYKLALVESIRKFAFDTLGLAQSDNYTTYYHHEKPIMKVIVAAPPYSLEPKKWSFLFVGAFPYIGYFNTEKAEKIEKKLQEQGYETISYSPRAWSTLGWFKDPVTTTMLNTVESELVRTIIHELTHATIFVKNDVELDENIATLVGDYGTTLYLKRKYGTNSQQFAQYYLSQQDYATFSKYLVQSSHKLEALYATFDENTPENEKIHKKEWLKRRIVDGIDTLPFYFPENYKGYFRERGLPNNAYFVSYKQYRSQQNELENELHKKFNDNLPAYIRYLKEKYGNELK